MNSNQHRNQDATVYVGNLDSNVNEALLWELFTQVGRVVKVYMPKDRVLGNHKNMAFVEFRAPRDAEYAQLIMNMVRVYGRPLRVSCANSNVGTDSATLKRIDVGANLFIGNLSPEVDDKILHDTFSAFGRLVDAAHVGRDDATGRSLSYGFVSYDSFEASDAALQAMEGQFLCGRIVNVSYAFKKDASKKGERERHGSAAERLLASSGTQSMGQKQVFRPHTHFSTGPNAMPIAVDHTHGRGMNGMNGMNGRGPPGMNGMMMNGGMMNGGMMNGGMNNGGMNNGRMNGGMNGGGRMNGGMMNGGGRMNGGMMNGGGRMNGGMMNGGGGRLNGGMMMNGLPPPPPPMQQPGMRMMPQHSQQFRPPPQFQQRPGMMRQAPPPPMMNRLPPPPPMMMMNNGGGPGTLPPPLPPPPPSAIMPPFGGPGGPGMMPPPLPPPPPM
jgi:splicing factor 3B subunit 4